ncbi:hypothetical protein CL622_07715 [archaeon]|nr:hypothetical protein [archaeon]|tara:strand:- start:1027 stop:1329 length:303 start_codon:yes stop_codon:yes gene_type:complete
MPYFIFDDGYQPAEIEKKLHDIGYQWKHVQGQNKNLFGFVSVNDEIIIHLTFPKKGIIQVQGVDFNDPNFYPKLEELANNLHPTNIVDLAYEPVFQELLK